MQVSNPPGSGKDIAEGKGVHREVESEEGGVRKLGIPTVIDRTIQQTIAQQLIPIYEPLFIETSYGYRPNKSAKDAILKEKEYAGKGYTYAVSIFEYIETFYNTVRIHSHCGYLSPNEYENVYKQELDKIERLAG